MILCSIQRTLGISDDNSVMNVIKKFMKHKLFVEQLLEAADKIYEFGNFVSWTNIGPAFHEAFRLTLGQSTITNIVKFLISLLDLSTTTNKDEGLFSLISCMLNELLSFVFKQAAVNPPTTSELCSLLNLLLKCGNGYLSSVKLITSSILESLECSRAIDVVEQLLQPILIPFLLKLQSYRSNENAQSCFLTLHEHCFNILNQYCLEPLPPIIFKAQSIDCDCNDCQTLILFLCDSTKSKQQFTIDKDRGTHFHETIKKLGSLSCVYEHLTDDSGQKLLVLKISDYEKKHRTCLLLRDVVLNMIKQKSYHLQRELSENFKCSSPKRFKQA
ncbi:unnamed protein product [Didymodactylos carnosus]|uniref:Uncharacterized protein n=1 Tax=Didymodactylos carnosus TaxID=1234261 RepID=A0A815SQW4_9BILA|nr:unnamed protein product [Didymodactylos carnosus]CAF1496820.1 unnamed protein product [Didymodactylos carnosus]CAF4139432.1 unnamed protein product [Didymodactylos carnosus]CAF4359169.1 unnamed protein product [Didymodactylos carnosus]